MLALAGSTASWLTEYPSLPRPGHDEPSHHFRVAPSTVLLTLPGIVFQTKVRPASRDLAM